MRERSQNNRTAFTLVELMVTVVVIVLVAGIALPSIVTLVTAGAQEQAYNLLAAQLASARALAMLEATYAGVHVQPADADRVEDGELKDRIYASVIIYNRQEDHFDVADGFDPRPLPKGTAFGEISDDFVGGDQYLNTFSDQNDIDDFTTFTIVFAPDGSVVRKLDGEDGDVTFSGEEGFFRGDDRLWDRNLANSDKEGVRAVCLFDYNEFIIRNASGRRALLNEGGRFLPINIHTGQVFPRE